MYYFKFTELFFKLDRKILLFILAIVAGGVLLYSTKSQLFSRTTQNSSPPVVETNLVAKFDYLSQNSNSSCSAVFKDSITSMPDNARLQGSCCRPMDFHRYSEQVEGLKKYVYIEEIPPDPYDIEAGLAKKLMSYYDMELTPQEQKAYDYAIQNSNEKGPCCCKCWRWYVYGGLGKLLIQKYDFTGEQVTEVWNLSDGCGGVGDHLH